MENPAKHMENIWTFFFLWVLENSFQVANRQSTVAAQFGFANWKKKHIFDQTYAWVASVREPIGFDKKKSNRIKIVNVYLLWFHNQTDRSGCVGNAPRA